MGRYIETGKGVHRTGGGDIQTGVGYIEIGGYIETGVGVQKPLKKRHLISLSNNSSAT